MAIFSIGTLISYFHKREYEKSLTEILEKTKNTEVDLREEKKSISIENYLKIISEHKEEIEKLKNKILEMEQKHLD